ncbi:hypothetical protein ACHAXR_004155 [Thalassiosira sp. AJA248-18]
MDFTLVSSYQPTGLVACPPTYNPSIALSYLDGSEVEVDSIVYRCNPYPFAIYCTFVSFRPKSSDGTSWNDAWEVIAPCKIDQSVVHTTTTSPSKRSSRHPATTGPTINPSAQPSKIPTNKPTRSPSPGPSSLPIKPTVQPALEPTSNPTTSKPTPLPSSPTISPSAQPSKKPTNNPSRLPFPKPSRLPTKSSTPLPSLLPSLSPIKDTNNSTASHETYSHISKNPTMSPSPHTSMYNISKSNTSYSPTSVVINVRADIRLELETMSRKLSDVGVDVFERSCQSFLATQFANMELLHIFNVSCMIASQQELLDGKTLEPRHLNDTSSLLLSVEVDGDASAADSITNASKTKFYELLHDLFTVLGAEFANELKSDGDDAGIDDFEKINEIKIYVEETDGDISDSISYLPVNNSWRESNSFLFWAIIGGVAAIVFAGLVHRSRRRSSDGQWSTDFEDDGSSVLTESADDRYAIEGVPENDQISESCDIESGESKLGKLRDQLEPLPPFAIFAGGTEETETPEVTQFDPLPPSCVYGGRSRSNNDWTTSLSVGTPTSMMCIPDAGPNQSRGRPQGHVRFERHVTGPPGKLGIIIKQGLQGCMIHDVKPRSPMNGLLFGEDLIIGFNGVVSIVCIDISI